MPDRTATRTPATEVGFAAVDRFLTGLRSAKPRPGYVLIGDETFLYERCRRAAIEALIVPGTREFSLHDFDLAESNIFEVLDRARTPSLMVPFEILFVHGVKALYTRGAKKEEFAAIDSYFRAPNPRCLILFVADHLRIPADPRRISFEDKARYERIRETLGEHCGMIELAQVEEENAAQWVVAESEKQGVAFDPDAAHALADALNANLMAIENERAKLLLYAGERRHVTLEDVEAMVLAAQERSLYELTEAVAARDAPRALKLLGGLLNASSGGEDSAIGHFYMLARTFRQMLVIREKGVRDRRAIWQALWQGFRVPSFAADRLIRQAWCYRSTGEIARALTLIARADIELRSQPPDKRLVLERLVLGLTGDATA